MPTPFIMPKFDMDQEDARIVSWAKHEGDQVRQDETVLVVETNKVAIDVPAPASGTLAGICAKEGETVPVGKVIAQILAKGEKPASPPNVPATSTGPSRERKVTHPEAQVPASRQASPVAQRMAQDLGVDLGAVASKGDRITKADVQEHLRKKPLRSPKVPATPAARRLSRELVIDLSSVAGSGPQGRVQVADLRASAPAAIDQARTSRAADVIPLVGMRRTIADRMQASFQEAPHIALTIEADVGTLEATRLGMNRAAEQQGAAKVTLTSLLLWLVARALRSHPYLNASLLGESVYLWKEINVGVATAVNDGLIVPVIRNADRLSIKEIAQILDDLTRKAREGKLSLQDVQDGTFTISNLGMFGIRQFRAVINPPESAILAVGSVLRRPVVINERDEIAVRPVMSLTLSADHRVLDGVLAAAFLTQLVKAIEAPAVLLY